MKQAVHNVTSIIAPALIEKKFDVETQLKEIDTFMCELDGTKGKKKLGANAILGVSMACARAGAAGLVRLLYSSLSQMQTGVKSAVRKQQLTRDRKSLSTSTCAWKLGP